MKIPHTDLRKRQHSSSWEHVFSYFNLGIQWVTTSRRLLCQILAEEVNFILKKKKKKCPAS